MQLPNLIIAGVQRAGTTSLFAYLSQHPDICASHVKELNYLFPKSEQGPRRAGPAEPPWEYAKHYAHCTGQRYRLEGSPSYWYGGQPLIDEIKKTLGNPRILVSLREPVSRFWSVYTGRQSIGRLEPDLSIDDYLRQCEEIEQAQAGRARRTRHTALSVGFYDEYLPPWLDAFGNDLYIVYAENLFAEPRRTIANLCTWLHVDPAPADRLDYQARNSTITPRSYRLAKIATTVRHGVDGRLWNSPRLRRLLRESYRTLNRGGEKPTLDPAVRERLCGIYAGSTERLAKELMRRGYSELPPWIAAGERSNRVESP